MICRDLMIIATFAALTGPLSAQVLQLDVNFGANGTGRIEIAEGYTAARDMTVTDDDGIVLAGSGVIGSGRATPQLRRRLSNGLRDTSFGIEGVASPQDSDGREYWNVRSWTASRVIAADGDRVRIVGSDGRQQALLPPLQHPANPTQLGNAALRPLRSGGFAIAVTPAGTYADEDVTTLWKFTDSAELDSAFATSGILELPDIGYSNRRPALLEMPSGALVVGVTRWVSEQSAQVDGAIAVVRVTSDGRVDRTFGDDGIAVVPTQPYPAELIDLFTDELGRILVLGNRSERGADGREAKVAILARLQVDGSVDAGSGPGGIRVIGRSQCIPAEMAATSGARRANGAIVVGGYSVPALVSGGSNDLYYRGHPTAGVDARRPALLGLDASLQPDGSVGGCAFLAPALSVASANEATRDQGSIEHLGLQRDGGLVVAAFMWPSGESVYESNTFLARLTSQALPSGDPTAGGSLTRMNLSGTGPPPAGPPFTAAPGGGAGGSSGGSTGNAPPANGGGGGQLSWLELAALLVGLVTIAGVRRRRLRSR